MRFPGVEYGFENSRTRTPKPVAPATASEATKGKRRASTDPDRPWQILFLIVLGIVLATAKFF